jgi:hypothetical protein
VSYHFVRGGMGRSNQEVLIERTILVPLPRFVFPTLRPPFLAGAETRVDKCFTDIDCASDTEFVGKGSHDPRHHAEANPLLKSPVTGLERRESVREVGPRCASP